MEVLASPVGQQKEIEDIQTGKEEMKLSLSADGMILYIENPKDSPLNKKTNLLELVNEFSKVERYKINIKKSIHYISIC